ncbi:hypothetical protein ACS0PU_003541 [Formica fusca]
MRFTHCLRKRLYFLFHGAKLISSIETDTEALANHCVNGSLTGLRRKIDALIACLSRRRVKNKRREPACISIYFTSRRQGTAFQYYRMIRLRYTLYCRRCPNLSDDSCPCSQLAKKEKRYKRLVFLSPLTSLSKNE